MASDAIIPGEKQRGAAKTARIPVKIAPQSSQHILRKPAWIRASFPGSPEVIELKKILRKNKLFTVCEEAACPNLGECFTKGTATFLVMGDICTRRCPFCDVAHGRPNALDADEPKHLAQTIAQMKLKYVVITSVNRDDLRDGGAEHIMQCVKETRLVVDDIKIEILTPDFRGRTRQDALKILAFSPPDVFNHNLETVPRLYKSARPGADYAVSLNLLREVKYHMPDIPTKSGIMLGLGESTKEVLQTLEDLREHDVDMLTLGQYLQPSKHHLAVEKYYHPDEFAVLAKNANEMGFQNVASGAMVRSSYHADKQADNFDNKH